MLVKLSWLTVEVFVDVFGEIPGQFDRGGSTPGRLCVDLPLCPTHDRSQIPNLNPWNTGEVFAIVGENLCESLIFHMEGIVDIHKIDVCVHIEVQRHIEQRGFRAEQIGRIQDLLNLPGDIRVLQFVKGFQRPDDLGDNQQAGRQFDFAAQGIAKESLGSLGFCRIVIGQKTEKHFGINEETSHARPSSYQRLASQIDEPSQNLPGALMAGPIL